MRLSSITFALLAGALVCGLLVSNVEADESEAEPREKKTVSDANNQFGVDLFKKLHKDGKNTFISPTSIAMATHMVNRAAKGETRSEIDKVGYTEELELTEANRDLMNKLGGRDEVTLNIANSLWADPARITLNKEYVTEMDEYFSSEVRAENFSDPATLDSINGWISDKTEGMIPKMLNEIAPDTVTYLINAIYFKGSWTTEFKEEDTKEADFHLADGSKKKVKLMKRSGKMLYGEIDGSQVVRLPYGDDKKVAMWVALPEEGEMDALVESLEGDAVSAWRKQMGRKQGTLKLPRFKMKFKKELSEDLQGLGMKTAFKLGAADLSRLGEATNGQPLAISLVLHEAVIEVNEEGTEAAAATIYGARAGSPAPRPQPKPFSMICDRPFLVVIADDITGSILFMGTVFQPENMD